MNYKLFGLLVDSELSLPLPQLDSESADLPEVKIGRGVVEIAGERIWQSEAEFGFECYQSDARTLLVWPEVRFAIEPHEITVDTHDVELAAILILQSVWSVVLSLNNRVAFHGGAVAFDQGAVMVIGESGSGKTTAMLRLLDAGGKLVSDDLITLSPQNQVVPGPPFIRLLDDLWHDRSGDVDLTGKMRYHTKVSPGPVNVRRIFVHTSGIDETTRVVGMRAVDALLRHRYNDVIPYPGLSALHLKVAADLAQSVPVFCAVPRSLDATMMLAE